MVKILKNQRGFTLIEMIVSLGIFSMIITVAVGALLVLIAGNQKLQNEQAVMSNLAFALDSMTREIRTGYNYYCAGRPSYASGGAEAIFDVSDSQEAIGSNTNNCPTGRSGGDNLQGVSFFEGGNSITAADQRILYFYDSTDKTIKRRVGDAAARSVISSGLEITDAEFFVTGAAPLDPSGNTEQPTVTIYIEAKEVGDDKKYYLQTTVTQRVLDL